MIEKDTMVVCSIGSIFVDSKKYSTIIDYRHYTKETDDEEHICLDRRYDAVDIIDVTMPIFCPELINLPYGTKLEYVSEIFKRASWETATLVPVGETQEVYIIKDSQFFIKRPTLKNIGSVTYRFYISEIEYSSYRPIVDYDKE